MFAPPPSSEPPPAAPARRAFYPMARGDLVYIVVVLAAAVIVFLPTWQSVQVWGMALRGWLLAALMLLSPIIALARLLLARPDTPDASDGGAPR